MRGPGHVRILLRVRQFDQMALRPRDECPSGRHVSVTLPHTAQRLRDGEGTERFSAITRRNSIPSRYRMVRFFHTHTNRYRFFILEKKYRRRKTRWRVNGKGRRERPVGKEPSWLTSATSPICCAWIMTGQWNWLTACSTGIPHRNYRRPTRTSDTVPRPPSRRSKRIPHYPKNSTVRSRHPRATQSHS